MFFEFRLYKVVGGRMKDIHGRFRDKLPPLFARHGIRNIGCWTALSSPAGPTWVYLLAYTSLAERTHQWDSFYADQDWWKTRSETNDGEEMVERFDTHFLTPNPVFEIPRPDPASPGLDELRFVEIALGQTAAANALLRDVYLPKIVASGGRPRLVADALTGPSLPRVALLIRWPDAEVWAAAREAEERDQTLSSLAKDQRASIGRTLLGRSETYLLRPAEWITAGLWDWIHVPA
jgi:hypothetical protein